MHDHSEIALLTAGACCIPWPENPFARTKRGKSGTGPRIALWSGETSQDPRQRLHHRVLDRGSRRRVSSHTPATADLGPKALMHRQRRSKSAFTGCHRGSMCARSGSAGQRTLNFLWLRRVNNGTLRQARRSTLGAMEAQLLRRYSRHSSARHTFSKTTPDEAPRLVPNTPRTTVESYEEIPRVWNDVRIRASRVLESLCHRLDSGCTRPRDVGIDRALG